MALRSPAESPKSSPSHRGPDKAAAILQCQSGMSTGPAHEAQLLHVGGPALTAMQPSRQSVALTNSRYEDESARQPSCMMDPQCSRQSKCSPFAQAPCQAPIHDPPADLSASVFDQDAAILAAAMRPVLTPDASKSTTQRMPQAAVDIQHLSDQNYHPASSLSGHSDSLLVTQHCLNARPALCRNATSSSSGGGTDTWTELLTTVAAQPLPGSSANPALKRLQHENGMPLLAPAPSQLSPASAAGLTSPQVLQPSAPSCPNRSVQSSCNFCGQSKAGALMPGLMTACPSSMEHPELQYLSETEAAGEPASAALPGCQTVPHKPAKRRRGLTPAQLKQAQATAARLKLSYMVR